LDSDLHKGFTLGKYQVRPLQGEISGPDGTQHVEPKVLEVLVCLAESPGQVVERENIARRVWGKVVVGDESITRCISELRRAFCDERKHPKFIQTLSKRGYRLLCAPAIAAPVPARVDVSLPVPGFRGRPAIAVLPFENMTGDPGQEYFTDGITEDIIMGLQRFHTFPVISRNSTFVFKDRTHELGRIARELGVGYIVTGTVRRQGDHVRLTVDLVDAVTVHNLWGQAYDLELGDLFIMQDEVVATLESEAQRAERVRPVRASTVALDTWDLIRKGIWHQSKLTRHDAEEAQRLFELALERDPDSVEALIQMSWWHFWDASTQRGPPERWEEMKRLAQRALSHNPREARALYNVGVATMMQGDALGARLAVLKSIELNPSHAWSYATLGTTYILAGEPELALEPIQVAMRLSPHDIFVFHAYGELAAAHHMLGDWDRSIEAAEHSLELRSGYWYAQMLKTASLARAGRMPKAERALRVLLRRRPKLAPKDLLWLPFTDDAWPAYFIEGLRLAGWGTHGTQEQQDSTRGKELYERHTDASRTAS
jgi:TolB-like protein/Tfp pilus assembly protein PilF